MAYALTLLALLGVFLWATPARTIIADRLRQAGTLSQTVASSSGSTLRQEAQDAIAKLRQKGLELLRKELHVSIDELVK